MYRKTLPFLLVLASANAFAYSTLFPQRTWSSMPVTIEVRDTSLESSIASPDPDNGISQTIDALNDAIDGWNGAVPGLVDAIQSSNAVVVGDGTATIAFNDPLNVCTFGCLAATLTGYYTGSTIDDADVMVSKKASIKFTSEAEDVNGVGCFNEYYIEGILEHEVGHVLGLAHSSTLAATMYSSVGSCNSGLDELHSDDDNGIQSLYP